MKEIAFNKQAKEKLKIGIDKLANSVICTLGPSGRNVVIEKDNNQVISTKDGVSVAKSIDLKDPVENMGAQMVKQAAIKTGEIAGDGTTTATLLAQKLIDYGLYRMNEKSNVVEIKRGMDKACKKVIEKLKEISKPINQENQFKQVATISANNDEEIGKIVSMALEKVGRDGVVAVEESKTGETFLETVEGLQFNRGYKSPHFVTNQNNMTSVLTESYVLIYDKKITQAKELLPILENISQENKQLLIIAEDIDGEALAMLVVNKVRGALKVCAVKAPDFGERRSLILEDISILTGGTVISSDKGMKLDRFDKNWLGFARTITVTKDDTTIVDGKGNEEKIKERLLLLKEQIEKAETDFEKEKLQDRLAKMIGGVSIINVGGFNEIDLKEKKDRIEDALQATKASIEKGILPGGGMALFQIQKLMKGEYIKNPDDETLGSEIVYRMLDKPFQQILLNAGYTQDKIYEIANELDKSEDKWKGFNPKTNKLVNMFDEGILDPTKVTITALENAVNVAGLVLLTEVCIYNEKKDEKEQNQDFNFGM